MLKNKSKLLPVFAVSLLLWGCASKKDEAPNIWTSTETIYSAKLIGDSEVALNSNGNVVLVWQEQQTEIRDDTATDAAHTFEGTVAAGDSHAKSHTHKFLYTKTSVKARIYDADSESWKTESTLKAGYWEKTKSGQLDVEDAADESKTVFDQNLNNVFPGDAAVAINGKGDVFVAWVQLAESATLAGDASTDHIMSVSRYSASGDSWSAPEVIATGTVVVQNKLALSLNDSNVAQLVWLGRDENGSVINAYQNTYDGTSWSAASMISDGNGSVKDIQLVMRNQSSGVALWTQHNAKNSAADANTCDQAQFNKTPKNLYANWFNASGWHTTPAMVNNGLGEVMNFSVASNQTGVTWASWSQTDNSAYPCVTDGSNSQTYKVSDVTTIWAGEFSGDIDADLSTGSWSAATNIQPDIASTAAVESALPSDDASIAVDSAGNVLVAWTEKGDATVNPELRKDSIIRANLYTKSSATWLTESFIVSDTAYFTARQPIEKTVPNDHVAPQVVSTGQNQFVLTWQYWTDSRDSSGYQLYSVDYNASNKKLSAISQVSEIATPVITQAQLYSKTGDVQLFWSQETDSEIKLNKSLK